MVNLSKQHADALRRYIFYTRPAMSEHVKRLEQEVENKTTPPDVLEKAKQALDLAIDFQYQYTMMTGQTLDLK